MAKAGRKPLDIPKDKFEVLMGIPLVTGEIICDFFKIHKNSLNNWVKKNYKCTFDDLKKAQHSQVKLKLTAKQYELAMKGDRAMLIWLGKQWLGQTEKVETKNETKEVTEFKIGWGDEINPSSPDSTSKEN